MPATNDLIGGMPRLYQATDDLRFTIFAKPESHYCEFTCYECTGWGQDADGNFTTLMYQEKGAVSSSYMTEDLAKAEVFLHGSIKWDGCANLYFDTQDECMIHFCGLKDAAKVGRLLARLYDLASELITAWEKEIAA